LLDGQVDAGIASLRNAVTEPRFCVGHYRLGIGLEKKGDPGLAEQSFTTAVTADPQCAELQDAWEARARVRLKLGKPSDAKQDYERCVEISKETPTGKICIRELAKLPQAAAPASTKSGLGESLAALDPNSTSVGQGPRSDRGGWGIAPSSVAAQSSVAASRNP
jgi:tetratricopeptide (TPR) repeat protein